MTGAMLRIFRTTLLGLLMLSTACTRTIRVLVPVQPPPCSQGTPPVFPAVSAATCDDRVCLSPEDVTAIWLYVRDTVRWEEHVKVCLDTPIIQPDLVR